MYQRYLYPAIAGAAIIAMVAAMYFVGNANVRACTMTSVGIAVWMAYVCRWAYDWKPLLLKIPARAAHPHNADKMVDLEVTMRGDAATKLERMLDEYEEDEIKLRKRGTLVQGAVARILDLHQDVDTDAAKLLARVERLTASEASLKDELAEVRQQLADERERNAALATAAQDTLDHQLVALKAIIAKAIPQQPRQKKPAQESRAFDSRGRCEWEHCTHRNEDRRLVHMEITREHGKFVPIKVCAGDNQCEGLMKADYNGRRAAPKGKKPVDIRDDAETAYAVAAQEAAVT